MKRPARNSGLPGGAPGKAGSETDSIDLGDGGCGPLRSTAEINQQASHTWAEARRYRRPRAPAINSGSGTSSASATRSNTVNVG